jgi:D-alanyl-lipoteichoic acid acyltransferase DltB (MBOAT superfamily)
MSYSYSLALIPLYLYYFKGKMPPRVIMTVSGISSYIHRMTVMVNTLVFDFDFLHFAGFRFRDHQLENTVFIGCINLITLNTVRHPEASLE